MITSAGFVRSPDRFAGCMADYNGAGEQRIQQFGDNHEQRSPSLEASSDPAPTRHEPDTDAQRAREKSKYEATEVYRSPKGDRFS